jgi:hypothetical protein
VLRKSGRIALALAIASAIAFICLESRWDRDVRQNRRIEAPAPAAAEPERLQARVRSLATPKPAPDRVAAAQFASPSAAIGPLFTDLDFAAKVMPLRPPTLVHWRPRGLPVVAVTGGQPVSCCSKRSQSVTDYITQTNSVAGINGTFFDFRPTGRGKTYRDRALIGPWMSGEEHVFHPETREWLMDRIRNRPLLVWGNGEIAIVPFQPETMNSAEALSTVIPGLTDVFLGGTWLVRDGKARGEKELAQGSPGDVNTPRLRAFVGLMPTGDFVMGATLQPANSVRLAEALAKAGVQEAVLLDSGMSTCLVYDGKQVAFGHLDRRPSRVVPHAICLQTVGAYTVPEGSSAQSGGF